MKILAKIKRKDKYLLSDFIFYLSFIFFKSDTFGTK